jgi:hypothetical protein
MDTVSEEWERIQKGTSGGCDIMYAVRAWNAAKEGQAVVSEPKRYSIVADYQAPWAKMHEWSSGNWVSYADYARLMEEVERLTKAGIAMGMALPDTDEANAAYRSFERAVKGVRS